MSEITPGGILLVGCGKMGSALLGGWLDQGIPPETITIVEPADAAQRGAGLGARHAVLGQAESPFQESGPRRVLGRRRAECLQAVENRPGAHRRPRWTCVSISYLCLATPRGVGSADEIGTAKRYGLAP